MTRASRGFTLLELVVVLGISAILIGIVVGAGYRIRGNATIAQGAYELALRISGLRAKALADGRDYVLVVVDLESENGCRQGLPACGRYFQLTNVQPAFSISAFRADAPIVDATLDTSGSDGWGYLPRGSEFGLAGVPAWRPEPPFDGVAPWDARILADCGGRRCFGLRFTHDGNVRPEPPAPLGGPDPAGFAFVLAPIERAGETKDRRGIFVSFPAGIVKTVAF